ncbi:MAG: ABC transporter permease [Chloroflexi bacterium]|nr:ABC transporter permease [Chloroflexota bacterium]
MIAVRGHGSSVRPRRGYVFGFAVSKPLATFGAALVLFILLAALLSPLVAQDPFEQRYDAVLQAPSWSFPLGTDELGRDVWSRVIWGSRISLYVAGLSVATGTTLGALLGLIGGFYGGRWDFLIQRLMDGMLAFPTLILALTIVAMLGASINNVVAAVAIVGIPTSARVLRSAALAVKKNEYVNAAQAIGSRNDRILFLHVLPNCLAPFIVMATVDLGRAIIVEASLSFLGVGTPPPNPSWGAMLSGAGRDFLQRAPWLAIAPGVPITLTVLGFNLLGDGLRDILDPRLR